jgi:hypothetical protein
MNFQTFLEDAGYKTFSFRYRGCASAFPGCLAIIVADPMKSVQNIAFKCGVTSVTADAPFQMPLNIHWDRMRRGGMTMEFDYVIYWPDEPYIGKDTSETHPRIVCLKPKNFG